MDRAAIVWVVAGGGAAWALHLFAGYFLVSLGCARGWPALGALLGGLTAACAAGALAVTVGAWRRRRRTHRADDEAVRLLLAVAAVLGVLFAIMIVLGGLTAAALPPCQAAVGGSR
jgi:heme/copper-type cytochrome/quinol oxidase subunit 3